MQTTLVVSNCGNWEASIVGLVDVMSSKAKPVDEYLEDFVARNHLSVEVWVVASKADVVRLNINIMVDVNVDLWLVAKTKCDRPVVVGFSWMVRQVAPS